MSPNLQHELKRTRPFDNPAEEVNLNVQRTYGQLMGPVLKLLREYELSPPLYNILRILRGSGDDGLSCSQIGDRMVTREPDVTRLVDRLDRKGWVKRDRCSEDRRVVTVTITRSGLELLVGLDRPVGDLHRQTLSHLSTKEMTELNRLLVKARSLEE